MTTLQPAPPSIFAAMAASKPEAPPPITAI